MGGCQRQSRELLVSNRTHFERSPSVRDVINHKLQLENTFRNGRLSFYPHFYIYTYIQCFKNIPSLYLQEHKTTLGEAEIQSAVEAAAVIFKKVVLQRREAAHRKQRDDGEWKRYILYII